MEKKNEKQHESDVFELNLSIETKVADPGNREQQIFKQNIRLHRFVISKLSQLRVIAFTRAKPRTSWGNGDTFGQQNQQMLSPGREPNKDLNVW